MITVVAAASPTHLIIRKGQDYFARTPLGGDRAMPGETDPELMRAALLSKWGCYRVLDENGKDLPEMNDDDIPIVAMRRLKDGETVYQITERIKGQS